MCHNKGKRASSWNHSAGRIAMIVFLCDLNDVMLLSEMMLEDEGKDENAEEVGRGTGHGKADRLML